MVEELPQNAIGSLLRQMLSEDPPSFDQAINALQDPDLTPQQSLVFLRPYENIDDFYKRNERVHEIGAGGQGKVNLVQDVRSLQYLVSKHNSNKKTDDSAFTELHMLRLCYPHPHIIRCVDAYWHPKSLGLVITVEHC